ncbi:MAG: ERF family protein [Dorea sp.]|jgi:hypothetical protein|nr:ERF family protein [Dorea sp.]
MAIHEKLLKIQSSISVPKNQYNKFGNYEYRSCEDILSALKPILTAHNCTVTVNDDLVFIGNRYYIKATVTLIDCESGESVLNQSFAREEESKKGMDSSQITGTASSYARKYALNGLLLLDDVKDSDTNENQQQRQNAGANKNQQKRQGTVGANQNSRGGTQKKLIDKKTLDDLRKRFKDNGVDETKVCSAYKVSDLSQLSVSQHENIIQHFEQVKRACAA